MKHHLDTTENCSYFPGYQRNGVIYRPCLLYSGVEQYLTMLMRIESLIVTIITNITIINNTRGAIWIDYMTFQTISKGINAECELGFTVLLDIFEVTRECNVLTRCAHLHYVWVKGGIGFCSLFQYREVHGCIAGLIWKKMANCCFQICTRIWGTEY